MQTPSTASTTPTIGIWGPVASGKTTYLAGLYLAFHTFAREWKMRAGKNDDDAKQFIETNAAKLDKGLFPSSTEDAAHKTYSFRLFRQDSFLGLNGRYHEIKLIDAAGNLMYNSRYTDDYFTTLSQSQGILLMIDPDTTHMGESYFTLLQRLFHRLDESRLNQGVLDINVAFCLTKIDQDYYWEKREDPKKLLKDILGQTTFNTITNYFSPENMAFFAISVVGRYKTDSGEERPNIAQEGGGYRIANFRKWEPYNMLDPLFWLFDRIEIERDSRLIWWRRWLRRAMRRPNYRK